MDIWSRRQRRNQWQSRWSWTTHTARRSSTSGFGAHRARAAGRRNLPPRRAAAGRRLARDRGVRLGATTQSACIQERVLPAAEAVGAELPPPPQFWQLHNCVDIQWTMSAPRDRMLEGLPVTERRLRLPGSSTVVLEGGDGPPLVLLHGGIESGGAILGAGDARGSPERHRVVVPDVPGLGESEPVADGWTPDDVRGVVPALCSGKTCEDRPALVGHSLGGALSARLRRTVSRRVAQPARRSTAGTGRRPLPDTTSAWRSGPCMFDLRPSEKNTRAASNYRAFFDFDARSERDGGWLEAVERSTRASGRRCRDVKRTMRRLIKRGNRSRSRMAELRRIDVPDESDLGSADDRFVRPGAWLSGRARGSDGR